MLKPLWVIWVERESRKFNILLYFNNYILKLYIEIVYAVYVIANGFKCSLEILVFHNSAGGGYTSDHPVESTVEIPGLVQTLLAY